MKPLLCSALLLLTFSMIAQSPTAVPIPKEPHHHLVFENDYVRVFRVSVPARDSTLLHQHDVPYVYVALGPAEVINAIQGKPEVRLVMADGQVGYSRGGFAHIARTDSDLVFNNVTIELLKPQGEPRNLCAQIAADAASGPCDKGIGRLLSDFAEPQLETAEMKLDRVRLDPKTKSRESWRVASLLVVLNNSEVQIEVKGKPTRTLHGGETAWLEERASVNVSNPSEKPSSYLQLYFRGSDAGVKL